jgi:hypothetical protein
MQEAPCILFFDFFGNTRLTHENSKDLHAKTEIYMIISDFPT